MESDNVTRDGKYSRFWSWWVEKLEKTGDVGSKNFTIREISGNGKYRRYLEPVGGLEDDIENWFDSDFESVEMTYDALGIVKKDGPLGEFLPEYKNFLRDKYYFILSNSAESPEVGRSYMKNVGLKILNKTYRGKLYLDGLCLFGRLVEDSILSTDEAKALQEKWRAACPREHEARE